MTDPQNNQQQQKAAKEISSAMPTGAQVHDALMAPIEADLTTENCTELDLKYGDETSEQRSARCERYKIAFKKYDAAFEDWVAGVDARVGAYRKKVLSHAQSKSSEEDATAMKQLESDLSSGKDV